MPDTILVELFKLLGIYGPPLGIMWYVMRDSQQERRHNDDAWRERFEALEKRLDDLGDKIIAEVRRGQ